MQRTEQLIPRCHRLTLALELLQTQNAMLTPRMPSRVELAEIHRFYSNEPGPHEGISAEDFESVLEGCAVAVFEGYATDGPGFTGKLATIVWSGGPQLVSTVTWTPKGLVEYTGELG